MRPRRRPQVGQRPDGGGGGRGGLQGAREDGQGVVTGVERETGCEGFSSPDEREIERLRKEQKVVRHEKQESSIKEISREQKQQESKIVVLVGQKKE